MHTKVVNSYCPDCGTVVVQTVLHNGIGAGTTSIGPSAIACQKCGTWVSTGKSEWSEKGFFEKASFIFGRLVWVIIGATVLAFPLGCGVGWLALNCRLIPHQYHGISVLVAYIVIALSIGSLLIRNALKEIWESRRRTESDADGEFLSEPSNPYQHSQQ